MFTYNITSFDLLYYKCKNSEPMMGFEPMTSSLPRKRSTPELHRHKKRAGNEARTRDATLGRVVLYQLSYSRILSKIRGESRIRTYEGICQQIYSLPQLATLVSPQHNINEPMDGFEPPTC